MMRFAAKLAAAAGLCLSAPPALAQAETLVPPAVAGAAPARIEAIKVHSEEIAGNLMGTPADIDAFVALPPSYGKEPARSYPVVYALHGYSIGAEQWLEELHARQTIAASFAKGTPEMIVVFPNGKNAFNGAFYANSVTTGNYENFIAGELIAYIDSHYRTLAKPESRGLVGHSMGGYGASRIGIRRAEMYGGLYLMSPCCQSALGTQNLSAGQVAAIGAVPSVGEAHDLPFASLGPLAISAAFSPNPGKPPLFADLPVDEDGKPRPEILAKRAANAPLAFLDQYVFKVRKYRGIAMDVGDKDGLVLDTTKMHEALLAQGIANTLEVYQGTHTSHIAYRFQDNVLPFFGRTLSFEE